MTWSTSSLAWVTVGAVFGFLFLLTCVISAVKAVRDRQRIKARNKAKRGALTNGQVPEDNSCVTCRKKLRSNLILIHDTEKEQRLKKGRRKRDSVSTTSFSITTPGVSSPGDLNSRCKEITTVVEMASQSASITCISGEAVDDDVTVDSQTFSDISCLVDKRNGDITGVDEISVDVGTDVIAYRRSSLIDCGQSGGSCGNLESAFPVPIPTIVDSVPFSDNCAHRDITNNPIQRHSKATNGPALHSNHVKDIHNFKAMLTTNEHASHSRQLRGITMSSFPGCSSSTSNGNNTLLHSLECRKELESADISPRRNSYAADLSGPACLEVPPKRRHSDECRRIINTSMSRFCQNAVRMRRFKRDGADNLAYESLDDEGIL